MDSWPGIVEQKELGALTFVYCINGCILPLLVHDSFPGPFEATWLVLELLEACQAKCCFLHTYAWYPSKTPQILLRKAHTCFNSLNTLVKNMANRYKKVTGQDCKLLREKCRLALGAL